jgi:PAP2 superfamily/Secretion system C-terminal sorting domain
LHYLTLIFFSKRTQYYIMVSFKHFLCLAAGLFLLFTQTSFTQNPASSYPGTVPLEWNKVLLEIDKGAIGFRPCPIATATAYLGLAGYETCVPSMVGYNSLKNSLSGLNIPTQNAALTYHYPSAVNAAYANLMSKFFLYLNPSQPGKYILINALNTQFHNQFATQVNSTVLTNSENWGNAVAESLWSWLMTDPIAYEAWLSPQTASYIPPAAPGLWQPTFPDFAKAMFPYYGTARLMAMNQSEKLALPPLPYSELPSSPMYQQAKEVFDVVNNIKSNGSNAYNQEWIAEFWSDDIKGLTFSPPARVNAIANQLVKLESLNLAQAVEMYAKLGIANNDVAVAIWHSKYTYNVERPASYIRRVLANQYPNAANWMTVLDNPVQNVLGLTPAFPAYPSGHSGFGGVMDGIFSSLFENTANHLGAYTMTDSSHYGRTEFISTPRTFTSFAQMGRENAESRVPLGVHYTMDCEEGLRLGKLAAQRALALPWKTATFSCNNIQITPTPATITITGLTSPITQVQVFDASWQRVYNCSGNCPTTTQVINNLQAGTYFVKANAYSATWQPICNKDQFVTVTNNVPTINCDNIAITTGAGTMTINGLTAPITQIQVFNPSWQTVFNCAGNCTTNSQTINSLPAGQYFVKVNFYTANWQPICAKDQFVTINGGGCMTSPTVVCKNISIALQNGVANITPADLTQSVATGCGTITGNFLSQNSFNTVGVYNVTLTVNNSAGLTNNCTAQVTVTGGTNPPLGCPGNLLSNQSYENSTTGWWTYGNVTSSNTSPFSGSFTLENCDPNAGGSGQTVAATAGRNYTAKVFGKITGTPAFAVVSMKFMNANFQTIGTETTKTILANTFTEYTLSSLAPTGTAYVQVWSWKAAGGCLYIDDWCLTQSGTANLIQNQNALSFVANRKGNYTDLKWATNSGNINDYVVVEKSDNGVDFEPILKIDAQGDAGEMLYFAEKDANPYNGDNYYRLRLVYQIGANLLSEVQKVSFPVADTYTLFPNPTSDFAQIRIESTTKTDAMVSICLINQMGVEVRKFGDFATIDGIQTLDLNGIVSGTYTVKIVQQGVRPVFKKLVVSQL